MLPLILEVKENWSPIMIRSEQICPRLMVNYVLRSGWVSICARGGAGLNLSTYIHSGTHSIQSGADISETNHSQLLRNSSWLFRWTQIFISMTNTFICAISKCICCRSSSIQSVVSLAHFPSGTACHPPPRKLKHLQLHLICNGKQTNILSLVIFTPHWNNLINSMTICIFRWSENKDTHSIGWG